MQNASPTLIDLAAALNGRGGLKVWSLIVTLMGDRLRLNAGAIQNRDLTAILGLLGITPQAIRVAVHRLRRDAWIITEKSGRMSCYSLTQDAATKTITVADLVYETPADAPNQLQLVVVDPRGEQISQEAPTQNDSIFWIGQNTGLRMCANSDDAQLLATVERAALPRWIVEKADHAAKIDDLIWLSGFLTSLAQHDPQLDVDVHAARLLALHAWRRFILRSNLLAILAGSHVNLFQECRAQFQTLMRRYQPTSQHPADATVERHI
jgi:phenylacetic acid degradation operon negative regulatory protein